jgi:ABC-2 type transport system permease protein
MTLLGQLVWIELLKLWRSRRLVFAVLFGLFGLIALGLYGYYVYSSHRASPPPQTPWRTVVQQDLNDDQRQIQNLQAIKAQAQAPGASVRIGGPFGANAGSIDDVIAGLQRAVRNDQYLLDNDVAPIQAVPVTLAAIFALGGIIMFLLTRIFGWLASEEIAGERSNRTIAILLSRPASRNQILAAKAFASFLLGLAVVLITFVIVYLVFAFAFGTPGPLAGRAAIVLDGSKPFSPDNVVAVPIPIIVLMCLGATMLAVLCVQGMSMLISVVSSRSAVAIGITLAVLFGAPVLSGIIAGIIGVISGHSNSSDFLKYAFFNVLAPVDGIAGSIGSVGNTTGRGMDEFGRQVATLAVWTVAFYAAAWALFHRRQEAS